MKKNKSTAILILVFFVGLSLLLYPTISDYWNSFHSSKAIATYAAEVAKLDPISYDQIWEEARTYNKMLAEKRNKYILSEEEYAAYEKLLDITGTGIMAEIEIPSVRVDLPVYHGMDESVLQVAAGHLEWTSLPVGGESTHCVISAHRGLPSAKLFTNLDELAEGDVFLLRTLDELLTYEVDQILIVEPEDISALHIESGKDLCTLVTCTPYGINSHRLLVRGHRVETVDTLSWAKVTSDALQVEPIIVAPLLALGIIAVLLVVVGISDNYKKKERMGNKDGKKKE
ncbi:MAG: class C sortase [Anaerotignum sp.]|nr:class C sortase [Anaerotignum sp.]